MFKLRIWALQIEINLRDIKKQLSDPPVCTIPADQEFIVRQEFLAHTVLRWGRKSFSAKQMLVKFKMKLFHLATSSHQMCTNLAPTEVFQVQIF